MQIPPTEPKKKMVKKVVKKVVKVKKVVPETEPEPVPVPEAEPVPETEPVAETVTEPVSEPQPPTSTVRKTKWSEEEVERLTRMIQSGAKMADIARELNRTESSIRFRLKMSLYRDGVRDESAKDENVVQLIDGDKVKPDPTPDPVPDPVPVSVPDPVPASVPDPVPASVPEPMPEPVPEPVPASVPDPVPASVPEPVPEPVPAVHHDTDLLYDDDRLAHMITVLSFLEGIKESLPEGRDLYEQVRRECVARVSRQIRTRS